MLSISNQGLIKRIIKMQQPLFTTVDSLENGQARVQMLRSFALLLGLCSFCLLDPPSVLYGLMISTVTVLIGLKMGVMIPTQIIKTAPSMVELKLARPRVDALIRTQLISIFEVLKHLE